MFPLIGRSRVLLLLLSGIGMLGRINDFRTASGQDSSGTVQVHISLPGYTEEHRTPFSEVKGRLLYRQVDTIYYFQRPLNRIRDVMDCSQVSNSV